MSRNNKRYPALSSLPGLQTQIFSLSASVKQKQSTNKSALQNKSQPEAQSSRTIKVTAKNFNKGFKVASLLFDLVKLLAPTATNSHQTSLNFNNLQRRLATGVSVNRQTLSER
jgi:hypothetical protein